jgi:hypothetical protein
MGLGREGLSPPKPRTLAFSLGEKVADVGGRMRGYLLRNFITARAMGLRYGVMDQKVIR